MPKPKITVFTPTYNRGYIIRNLYESLRNQTYKDFEWIVIDDGSNDHTQELFHSWLEDKNDFPIFYLKVENGGKHRAINRALDMASGELFFIVDSDDYLINSALEKISGWERTLEQSNNQFVGISGNKGYSNHRIIGETFDGEFVDATSLERVKYNILGDKAEVFYTHILRKYKFPEIDGENFITEAVVWEKIANDGFKIRWFNEIIYFCDYLDDGLTKAGMDLFYNNPKGYALYLKQQIVFYNYSLLKKMGTYIKYYVGLKGRLTKNEISLNLDISKSYLNLLIVLKYIKSLIKGII
ncbi:MAG: glycosyltransferase family 2 protein [Bacillus sp. (in: firmicutes)]